MERICCFTTRLKRQILLVFTKRFPSRNCDFLFCSSSQEFGVWLDRWWSSGWRRWLHLGMVWRLWSPQASAEKSVEYLKSSRTQLSFSGSPCCQQPSGQSQSGMLKQEMSVVIRYCAVCFCRKGCRIKCHCYLAAGTSYTKCKKYLIPRCSSHLP